MVLMDKVDVEVEGVRDSELSEDMSSAVAGEGEGMGMGVGKGGDDAGGLSDCVDVHGSYRVGGAGLHQTTAKLANEGVFHREEAQRLVECCDCHWK